MKTYVGDAKTQIEINCHEDISSATVIEIIARKPNGTVATWSATLLGTNSLKYVTDSTTLDQSGIWKIQPHITMPTWGPGLGETDELIVYDRFK